MNMFVPCPDPASPPGDLNCLLTLALPLALEEELLDLLHAQSARVPGFTVVHGQGMGAGAVLGTVMEQVQGRARRVLVQSVMRETDVAPLVAELRRALPATEVFYWVVPLLTCGSLA